MIKVIWYCARCGRRVRHKDYYNVHPYDHLELHDEWCYACEKEYKEIKARHEAEENEFLKGAKQ
jgi:DNA-directed RNA polymerase subunit RPC12/RpoP